MKKGSKTKGNYRTEAPGIPPPKAEWRASGIKSEGEENALLEERNLLRTLMDSVPDHIYVKDTDSRFVLANIALAHHMGAETPDELVGKTDFDFYPEELAARYYADERMIVESGQPMISREEAGMDRAGNRMWFLVAKVPLRSGDGKIVGLVGTSRDITERKRAEEALRESESKSKTLLESLPQKIFWKDRNSVYVSCNENFARDLGIRTDEFAGKTDYDFFPKALAEKYRSDDRRIIESGNAEDIEEKYVQDGEERIVQTFKTPVRNEEGKTIGILGIFWDITDRKRAEKALRDSEALYHSLVENLPLNVFRKDLEGKVTFGNALYCKTMGRPLEEIIGKNDFDFFPKELAKKYRWDDKRVIETGQVFEDIEEHQKPDGDKIHVQVVKTPVHNSKGEVIGTQGIFWDVTERNRAEKELTKHREHLEELVEERTAELRKANQQLRREITERKRAEKASRDSEALYHSLVESLPLNVFRKDLEGRFTFANKLFCDGLGKPLEEIIGKTDFDFFPAELGRKYRSDDRRVIDTGEIFEDVEKHQRPDGQNMFVQVMKTPVYDSKGEITGIQGIFWDVTDRKHAEEALTREKYFVDSLMDNLPDNIYFKDEHSRFTKISRELSRRFGLSDESEALGKTDFAFFTEEHARSAFEDEQEVMRSGKALVGKEEKETWPDGHVTWVSTTKMPLFDEEGKIIGTFGISRDVTDRKRAQEALRDSEALYHSLVESLPLNVFRKDLEGTFTFGNTLFCDGLGKPLEGIIGKTDLDFFPAELAEKYRRDDKRVRETGQVFEDIEEHQKPDGDKIYVQVFKTPVRNFKGKVIGTQGIFWDVTQRKRAEEELKKAAAELARSNAELEQFAYIASHDLQEPLRMVASFTQLLVGRYKGRLDKDADEFMGYIVDGATRMQSLIQDLLAYSRVGTRAKPFKLTDCGAVLERVLGNLVVAIEESGAVVTHDTLPTVMADDLQLNQLFQNLIGNAIKFRGEEPPRVQVSAKRERSDWVFSVRDNGIGIGPQYVERIFTIFQRLHSKEEYPGTGMGLAICKKILERHGGRIWVESQPGKGSIFYFTIPNSGDPQL